MNSSIITIPIYKTYPDYNENISFEQCLKILSNYPICIFTYKELDISYYTNVFINSNISFRIEYFDITYFENIAGYNKLMLSIDFYKRFKDFEYILLYQLDAWVFRDELDLWCQKGFDYIGAPLFDGKTKTSIDTPIIGVGNGGFSLRKVKKMYQLLNRLKLISNILSIFEQIIIAFPILRKYTRFARLENSIKNAKNGLINEDFIIMVFSKYCYNFHIAPYTVALLFSFDANPRKLFNMSKNKLPFGCHAWNKHEQDFWKTFIN